jgi:adenylate cyclase
MPPCFCAKTGAATDIAITKPFAIARVRLPPISIGIGIDRGPGLAGLLGSDERREYAFIGRAVNLAARIQTLTRIHQVDILVSEALRAALAPEFIVAPMPAEAVKGFADPVVTYAVRGVQPILSRLTRAEERDNVEHT